MCGIAGLVGPFPMQERSTKGLASALGAMKHGGPDSEGRFSWRSPAGFGI